VHEENAKHVAEKILSSLFFGQLGNVVVKVGFRHVLNGITDQRISHAKGTAVTPAFLAVRHDGI
jgi:hypothetical protein